jgi:hypothetical protein
LSDVHRRTDILLVIRQVLRIIYADRQAFCYTNPNVGLSKSGSNYGIAMSSNAVVSPLPLLGFTLLPSTPTRVEERYRELKHLA